MKQGRHDPDQTARWLRELGRVAYVSPPAWQGAQIKTPIHLPTSGQRIGFVLPGRGVVLDDDLSAYGITRGSIPHVIERSLFEKVAAAVGGRERLALTLAAGAVGLGAGWADLGAFLKGLPLALGVIGNYGGIVAARAGGKAEDRVFAKASVTTVANTYHSLLRAGGQPPAISISNIPGGTVCDRSNAGALSLALSNPTGGDSKYLLTFGFNSASTINMLVLIDLLVAAANINANTTSANTCNTSALSRYTSGAGVQMALAVTTALGATPSNCTISYTDQDNNAGASTGALAMTASAIVTRLQPQVIPAPFVTLASGDYGVRSVQTVTFSAAMGAGVLDVYLYMPLAYVPGIVSNAYVERDATTQIDGITELVQDGSNVIGCLGLIAFANTTSSGAMTGFMRTVAG